MKAASQPVRSALRSGGQFSIIALQAGEELSEVHAGHLLQKWE